MSKYGIFSGCFGDDDAVWIESVEGLEVAFNRMKEMAAKRPGKYFVFSANTRDAVGSVDTARRNTATDTLRAPHEDH